MIRKIHAGTPGEKHQTPQPHTPFVCSVCTQLMVWVQARWLILLSCVPWSLTLLPSTVDVCFHLWIVPAWQGKFTCCGWWYKAQCRSIRLHFGANNLWAWPYTSILDPSKQSRNNVPQGWKCPDEFIGEMKAGESLWMCGHTTWCPEKGAACTHYIQHSTTWSSWAHWEMLGGSWLCASLQVRRSHRWGLLSEDRTC